MAGLTPERHRSPTGEEFVVARRAGPVAFDHPPHIPAEAGEELLVVKSEQLFLCAHEDGDVHPTAVTGEGLYFEDTRHLSELRVRISGTRPVLLSRRLVSGHEAVVDATNATLHDHEGDVPQKTVNVRRTLIAAERLHCVLRLRSFNLRPVVVELDVDGAADFADMFEVRGAQRRNARGRMLVPKRNGDEVTFAYAGEDGEFRETLLSFDPGPDRIEIEGERARARWTLTLEQGQPREILVAVEPARASMRAPARTAAEALAERDGSREAFERGCTRIATDRERIDRVLDAGLRDVHALLIPVGSERIVAAGMPWFVAPFGRDSLIAALRAADRAAADRARHAVGAGRHAGSRGRRVARRGARQDPARAALRRAGARWLHPAHALLRNGRRHPAVPHAGRRLPPLDGRPRHDPPAAPGARRRARVDRRLRRRRRRRLRRVRAALPLRPAQPWLEGLRRLGRPRRRVARGGSDSTRRGAGIRLRGQARHRRGVRGARRARSRRAAARRRRAAARGVQRRLLGSGRGLPRARARRRQASGAQRRVEPGALPLVRDRRRGQGEPDRRAPDGAGHVLRLGDPDAVQHGDRVQPDELSQRLGVAARQRARRRRLAALRLQRRGGADRRRDVRRRGRSARLTVCPSCSAASAAIVARSPSPTRSRAFRRRGPRLRRSCSCNRCWASTPIPPAARSRSPSRCCPRGSDRSSCATSASARGGPASASADEFGATGFSLLGQEGGVQVTLST